MLEKEEEEATKEGSAIYNAKDTFLDSSAGCQKLRSSGATELSLENGWHCFGWPCVCVCVLVLPNDAHQTDPGEKGTATSENKNNKKTTLKQTH